MTTTTLNACPSTGSAGLSSGNDGTLTIQTGATSGSQVNALVFAADGTPTFLKQSVVPLQSMVRVNTVGGNGSTNTAIRYFNNVTNGVNGCVIQGADITFANDTTNGASFTINTSGVYAMSFGDQTTGVNFLGISINSALLTTNVSSLAVANIVCVTTTPASGNPSIAAATMYLAAGSVIRPHVMTAMAVGANPQISQFIITRVS